MSAPPPFRLAVDASPLMGQRSGVGRYLDGVLTGLATLPGAPRPVLANYRPHPGNSGGTPPGAQLASRALPRRLVHRTWSLFGAAPIELHTGRAEVFHGGNFVLPRLRAAVGVVTVHDLAYLRYPDTVDAYVATYRARVPDALQRAARVVTVSAAVREELCAQYPVDPARVLVAPNGVDAQWARARPVPPGQRVGLGLPERYLLFVGNVEPRKGLPTLARAHAAARRSDPSVPQLVLVGPAGWGDAWDGYVPEERDVVRLGYLPDDLLRQVVAGAVAVCLPSRYEGFGLPVLEALACGRPALASDIAAHREVAGAAATLVAPGDVDAWAQALVDAGTVDPATGAAARRARAEVFTWERSAALHLAAWRSAASEGMRRG